MWASISNAVNQTDPVKGYNLILLDNDDCHVHAFVFADSWKTHSDKFVEGGIYVLFNFYTKEPFGSLKPVSSKILINFSPTTSVERVDDDIMISNNKFEFVDLSELLAVASTNGDSEFPEYSIDVMHVVEGYETLSKIKTKFGMRDIVKFRLTDGRHSCNVTVWGKLAITMEDSYNEIAKDETIIVILTSTKLTTFRKTVQISTLPASKVYLNLDFDAVLEMRQRFQILLKQDKSVLTESQDLRISVLILSGDNHQKMDIRT
ncbi:hypothetical protein AgCh_008396 [Apium graveolens]